ncbi:ABC transporter substrate-binding protein [Caldisalinibacter kiritimatiensis]|uniref:N-Acetyl-D-glucosamine ABC transport system, sugar-binding protein n=1 Tax=Caldisalinibacter kiritimatiensis TaxID=1304284 RepID=R1CGW8_9FIRM|nr:ABC transporter substrate-binding protein [Caldisalinibacter kiritimatiensis]EOD01540.1 N-Acetyl-D-glucosamine ABC transport system, sugar-binding protein [Caldisalinibacter kiritimatiensis]
MKKVSLLLVVLMLTGSLLVGCGGDNTASNGPVTIKIGMWASSPAETELVDKQIAEFEKTYPNINIEKEVYTDDYLQQLQANIAAKTEPDVYYLDVYQAPAFMEKEVILPLDEYLDKNDVKDFEENLLNGFMKDGKIYGLPKDYNTLALFYNKEMFEEAGVDVPTTWAELEEAAKKLTKDGVKGIVLSNDAARFIPFIYQAGGKVVDENNSPAFTTSEAAKGLGFYYSLLEKGYADTPANLGVGWNGDALAQEKAAMCIEGGWMIPFMKEAGPEVDYGIAKLPRGDKEGDLAFTVAYVMSKNTEHKEEAAEVIKFLTGKKAQEMVAESGLAIPTRKSMSQVFVDKYPERKPLVDMVEYSKVYQFGVKSSKILDELNNAGTKLQKGVESDSARVLKEAAENLK